MESNARKTMNDIVSDVIRNSLFFFSKQLQSPDTRERVYRLSSLRRDLPHTFMIHIHGRGSYGRHTT